MITYKVFPGANRGKKNEEAAAQFVTMKEATAWAEANYSTYVVKTVETKETDDTTG